MLRTSRLGVSLLSFAVLFYGSALAQPPMTAQEIIEYASLDDLQLAALEAGEIVPVDASGVEREQEQRIGFRYR